jgi:hypothetical protein
MYAGIILQDYRILTRASLRGLSRPSGSKRSIARGHRIRYSPHLRPLQLRSCYPDFHDRHPSLFHDSLVTFRVAPPDDVTGAGSKAAVMQRHENLATVHAEARVGEHAVRLFAHPKLTRIPADARVPASLP